MNSIQGWTILAVSGPGLLTELGAVFRFPGPFHLIGRALFRIPPQSRLRRRTAPYLMARAYAAGNRRDFDLIRTFNDLSVYEYRASADLLPPDLEQVSSRHKGYLQMWQRWIDAFEDIRFEPARAPE